jgi:hypothetical protein
VLKSGTLLSATPKIGSEGGVPLLFIKRSDEGVALLFMRRAKIVVEYVMRIPVMSMEVTLKNND